MQAGIVRAQTHGNLERWCDSVRTRAEDMLSSSLNTTSGAELLSTKPDFSKTEVVKAYVHTIVTPGMDYWTETIEVKRWVEDVQVV